MRIASLTGLRGIAAVSVLIYHIPHHPAFERFGLTLFDRAYLCVDLFFVLSGFVIAYGYYSRVVEHPGLASYGDFLVNRLARVWPLHFIVTLVFLARFLLNISGDGGIEPDSADVLANLFMVQSWGLGTQALAGNSWSVSTEMIAYLAFPLIAVLAFSRWAWAQAAVAVGLLLTVAHFGQGPRGPLDVIDGTTVLPMLRCIAGFMLGVIAYRLSRSPRVEAMLGGDAAFAGICLAIAIAFVIPRGDVMVALLWPLLVVASSYDGRLSRWVSANPLVFHLGLISYSIYLWHPLVRDMAARGLTVAERHGFAGWDWAFVMAALAGSWAISWASYKLVEVRGHRAIKWAQRRLAEPRAPVTQAG